MATFAFVLAVALAVSATSGAAAPEGGKLKLSWSDCGDSSTHGHIKSLSPEELTIGSKTSLTGKGSLDEAVQAASYTVDAKAMFGIPVFSHTGDACKPETIKLPKGLGEIDIKGFNCPISPGDVELDLDVSLSSSIPERLARLTIDLTAKASTGDKELCVKISTAPEGQDQHCETEYEAFLATFPKKSPSLERFATFCSNLAITEEHNAANARWSMGINEFSDWTDDEKAGLLGWDLKHNNSEIPAFKPTEELVGNSNVDWRSRMPPVKSQKQCGSCWAFSAIDVVDFLTGGSHSEQQLVDCSGQGCKGGNPSHALQYLIRAGSASEKGYPYRGQDGSCRSFNPVAKVSDVHGVSGASGIASALQRQVVSVCFHLKKGSPFFHYHSGVYDTPCGSGEGHCVAAVGYASDYWIIRNSWGSNWGQHGYIYFKRGSNLCNMESSGTIAKASGSTKEAMQVVV